MGHCFATVRSRLAALSATLLILTACGGGGGGGGGGFLGPEDPNANLDDYTLSLEVVDEAGNATTRVSSTRPATLRVLVREDSVDADPVSGAVVSADAEFTVIRPENGQALTDADGIAEFELSAGSVVGADTITVTVDSPAGSVTATVGVQTELGSLNLGFFDGTTFVNGEIGVSADNLAFGGSAALRLAIVDENGDTATSAEEIRLSSACSLSGQASFRPLGEDIEGTATLIVETTDGLANAEYLAGSCEGDDDLTAELVGADATATATVSIAGRDANFIGFVSADPSEGEEGAGRTIIALRGTGGPGRPEVATLVFEVLEAAVDLAEDEPGPGEPGYLDNPDRVPLAGIEVDFALSNTLGGITLLNDSGTTDASGLVEVEIRAGNVATSTLVIASFDAADGGGTERPQEATSNQVVISTGLPDQNSISLSTELFHVPRAGDIDGINVALTIRMADKFNNPVADGTSAVFTTEYGTVDSSCLTGVSNGARFQAVNGDDAPLRGTCSVLWTSQAPRLPVFNRDKIQTIEDDGSYLCSSHTGSFGPCPDDLGAIRGLRSTVLVTTVGEESFVDGNGNGLYDEGEAFENLPEAFLDMNEDGVYTPVEGPQCGPPSTDENCEAAGAEEEFVDFNEDGSYSRNVDPNTGEGVYNGSLCPPEGDDVFCSRDLVNVRTSTVLTLTSSAINLRALAAKTPDDPRRATDTLLEGSTYEIYVADIYNNAPGAGTTLTFRADADCEIVFPEETDHVTLTVPDLTTNRGAYTTNLRINGTGAAGGGRITLSATDPEGDNPAAITTFACQTSCDDVERDEDDNIVGCNEEL